MSYDKELFPTDAEKRRSALLKKNFGITAEEFEHLMVFQKGGCAICGRYPKKLRLSVDHDHRTGLVRGLLCSFCNRGIATFHELAEVLEKAAAYMRNPPAVRALGGARYGYAGRVGTKRQTTVLRRALGYRGRRGRN